MTTPLNILALIPARGGSKGVPRKNIRTLAGKPLIQYAIDGAKKSRYPMRVVVSTDDEAIAKIAKEGGAEVPFLRPGDLAIDSSPTLPVIRHAIEWLDENDDWKTDLILLLQPTAPLRGAKHIDEAIDLLLEKEADAVVSVAPIPAHFHPRWQFELGENDPSLQLFTGEPLKEIIVRRQDLSPTYTRNGAIYAIRREAFEATNSLYGNRCLAYVMPEELSVNIDTLEDWKEAEAAMARQEKNR